MTIRTAVRGSVLALGLALSLAGCVGTPQPTPTAQAPTQAPVTNPPRITYEPAPVTPVGVLGDGEYIVGTDLQPGTYRSAGPSGTTNCYAQRYADLTKEKVIKTSLSKGQVILEVLPTDRLVVLTRCQPFTKIG